MTYNTDRDRKEITKSLIESVQDVTEIRGGLDPLVHMAIELFSDLDNLTDSLKRVEDNLSFNSNKAIGKRPAKVIKAIKDIRNYLESVETDAKNQTKR
jgi:hypothetical protein